MNYRCAVIPKVKASESEYIDAMLSSWQTSFENTHWHNRLSLLEQIDENIEIGARHGGPDAKLSQRFTRALIDKMKGDRLLCREQAYVYLNSDDEEHRQVARMWLTLREHQARLAQARDGAAGAEKRTAPRREINLPGLIACNDYGRPGRVLDVSVGGARIGIKDGPKVGTTIALHVPLIEPIAASVVWLASTSAGLAFLAQQPGVSF